MRGEEDGGLDEDQAWPDRIGEEREEALRVAEVLGDGPLGDPAVGDVISAAWLVQSVALAHGDSSRSREEDRPECREVTHGAENQRSRYLHRLSDDGGFEELEES